MMSFRIPAVTAALAAILGTGFRLQEIEVRRAQPPPAVAAWRASLREGRPALRGFRAPLPGCAESGRPDLARPGENPPIDLPQEESLRQAAGLIARNLARDGLLATTAAAIANLGAVEPELSGATERLRAIGLPVDWLEFFLLPGQTEKEGAGTSAIVRQFATVLASGASVDSVKTLIAGATFAFRPSLTDFSVATESGESEIGIVRLQLASPGYWMGPGDGGSLDIARQVSAALPEADFFASVEEKHLEKVLATAREWSSRRSGRWTLISESLPVSQWAQDDGKPGLAPATSGSGREVVTLVPRYASRGEDGASLVPGESFLIEGFACAGHRVVQSPLLFQGGDLLATRDPKSGERLLLVGEANVWRNVALGLSREQVLEAFRVEFGVDRCKALPAVSFHIDQELTLRTIDERLIAFVADPVEAVRIILKCGVDALESAGVLSSSEGSHARDDLDAGKDREFLERVVPAISSRCTGFGRFPESLASAFARGPADSGVGNLQRFLLASDLLMSWSLPVDELPLDPHSIAYLRSFQRRDADRRAMIADLRKSGFEVARIPSMPEATRGIDYLNGIQDRTKYLMPAWGGLYTPLDQAALAAFRRTLGTQVEVIPIYTSESQRRGGALHCSLSACPRP
jgi:hypothetical protein